MVHMKAIPQQDSKVALPPLPHPPPLPLMPPNASLGPGPLHPSKGHGPHLPFQLLTPRAKPHATTAWSEGMKGSPCCFQCWCCTSIPQLQHMLPLATPLIPPIQLPQGRKSMEPRALHLHRVHQRWPLASQLQLWKALLSQGLHLPQPQVEVRCQGRQTCIAVRPACIKPCHHCYPSPHPQGHTWHHPQLPPPSCLGKGRSQIRLYTPVN